MRAHLRLILFVALFLGALNASACPVCFSAKKGSRAAFIGTTVLLSALPFTMATGFVVWYRRKSRELERE